MDAGPRIDSYAWRGGREAMLRFGPQDGPVVVLALPLFEEANRTRALGIGLLRALAARGIGGILPDLPGQGESETPTDAMRLADLRDAYAAVPGGYAVAVRSGVLIVGDRWPCWTLAPQDGPALLRELRRLQGHAPDAPIAGNRVSSIVLGELASAALHFEGGGYRTLRLASDPGIADRHVEGAALWRRAEPGSDGPLAEVMANDIAAWITTCVA